jgi:hypothetical protein
MCIRGLLIRASCIRPSREHAGISGSTTIRFSEKQYPVPGSSPIKFGERFLLVTDHWILGTDFQGGILRKYLGVLAGMAALCLISWAQAPTPTPAPAPTQTPDAGPQAPESTSAPTPAQPPPAKVYPRIEFFAGGSYAQAGFFNSGHWAGLPGWDASFGANATSWLGFVAEGGQYFGTSKLDTLSPAPFPSGIFYKPSPSPTFDAQTREYNFLFGVQFARRKYVRWTPFGELLYGHQGVRGIATPVSAGPLVTEVSTGRALVAGAGIDHSISPRLALRIKADYLESATDFKLLGKEKQDNFRFSVGIVIRNVHKKKRTLEDETGTEP